MFEIMVEGKFDAAHCLRGYQGDCERLHGHTYRVQSFLHLDDLDEQGMAIDFKIVKKSLKSILDYLDHICLNDLPEFTEINPTAENIAKFIYDKMSDDFGASVHKVTVWETASSAASYWRVK